METRRQTYESGINKFAHFCNIYHVTNPLPISQSLLCSYISHLANSGLAYGTIKTYLAAVRYLQISNDLLEPQAVPMPKLSLVERGIRHTRSEESSRRSCLPITSTILHQLRSLWSREASDYDVILMGLLVVLLFRIFQDGGDHQAVRGWLLWGDSEGHSC